MTLPLRQDARRERRIRGEGSVRLRFSNPQPQEVAGRLVDVSTSGFRMAHASKELPPGQVVEFQHASAQGSARVIWNRIFEDRVETGFLVLALR